MAEVNFAGVSRHFPGAAQPAVAEVDLGVADGEVVVLTGPPGSGKTTLLRLTAGLEIPDAGVVTVGAAAPVDAEVALVFQNYAVYPSLSVSDNISVPLRRRRVGRRELASAVADVVELLGLGEVAKRPASSLSTSERMRVALARSLVRRPDVLLMDEPLANLEHGVREELRDQLVVAQQAFRTTTLYATGTPEDVPPAVGRVLWLEDGRLAQRTGATAD